MNEQRWLPVVAPRLPLPVPAPVRAGRAALGYPWPWSVVPLLPGQLAAREPPADPAGAAASLGGFLAALHAPAPPDAPANPNRGIPLAERAAAVTDNLSVLGGLVDRGAATRAWRAALATPAWGGAPVWVHGDLHPANILVRRGRISGVIDFGDITAGDPATDLSVAWMLLPTGLPRGLPGRLPRGGRPRGRRRHLGPGAGLGARAGAGVPGQLGRQPADSGDRPPHHGRRARLTNTPWRRRAAGARPPPPAAPSR